MTEAQLQSEWTQARMRARDLKEIAEDLAQAARKANTAYGHAVMDEEQAREAYTAFKASQNAA